MQKVIQNAMAALAQETPDFGITFKGQNNREELENAFQEALRDKLDEPTHNDGWSWHREVKHNTFAFPGGRRIMIDIVGVREGACVAIELKYVTHMSVIGGAVEKPSNPPAFSYDVVKDCAKLEVLQERGRELVKDRNVLWKAGGVQGFVIALTNWPRFWGEGRLHGAWSANFSSLTAIQNGAVLLPGANNGCRIVPTTGTNPERTIFGPGGKRCHVSLAQDWQGQWHDFGPTEGQSSGFRYLLLANKPTNGSLSYTHDPKSPDTVPFCTKEACEGFRQECERVRGDNNAPE